MLTCINNGFNCSCIEIGGTSSEISNNHDHKLFVPPEDFQNPVGGTYSIQGEADHDHSVTFTAEELEIVTDNNSNTQESSAGGSDNHTHMVTLDCGCE